jgi:type I restriction enzyme M protein
MGPTDEFFNTGIYTYLWVLNKNKEERHKNSQLDKLKELRKALSSDVVTGKIRVDAG